MIIQMTRKYDFSALPWVGADEIKSPGKTFAVSFKAVPAELAGPLFVSAPVTVTVENKSEKDYANLEFNRSLQNYFSVKSPDGSCRVMEVSFRMVCDWIPWKVGFPLALIEDQNTEHEFTVLFDGVYLSLLCDGVVMDREAPEGDRPEYDVWNPSALFNILSSAVSDMRCTNDISQLTFSEVPVERNIPAAYCTPAGFNTWIGDVVVFAHKELFHIFYLHDRRHHRSRRGKGAHEFWHMTSTDLKNWVDHGPVLELTEPWQSTGTGNAFVYKDKLHLSYGWHTERALPWPKRSEQLVHINLSRHGHTGVFDEKELGELIPCGAFYLSSDDGLHFTPGGKMIHFMRNPSIFPQKDGTLHLYQDGKWESDTLGNWRLTAPDFPPRGKNSFARNCTDCPCFFTLGDWEYFAVGFTGFFGKPAGTEEWIDFTEKGWEPYDGANVPMMTHFKGRLIEGSWPSGNGWGSCLLLREIIPLGNGRLGKRWIPETLPEFKEAGKTGNEFTLPECTYGLLEVEVDPSAGPVTVLFTGREGETPAEFTFDPQTLRAQWSGTPGAKLPSCREKLLEHPEYHSFSLYDNIHFRSRDYAREQLIGLEEPFTLRMIICRDPKFNSTLIDAELGGKHTMLTHRNDLHADKVLFKGNTGSPRFSQDMSRDF